MAKQLTAPQQETEITQDQINQWKQENPIDGVFRLKTPNAVGYIKGPDRLTLSYALTLSQTDPLAMIEEIFDKCWLGGDEQLKNDRGAKIGIIPQMDAILEVKAVQVEKL